MSWMDTLEAIRTKDFSRASVEEQDKAARDVVNLCGYACAVVAVSPIPFSDVVLMLPVQSAMVVTVGHIYGRKVTQAAAKDLILELGATAGLGLLARQGLKALLPVVGALLTVPAAFAANWAMGRVAMEYFKFPGAPKEQLKRVYENAKAEASDLFSRERFERFRKGEPAEKPATPKRKAPAKKKAARPKAPARPNVQRLVEVDLPKRLAKHPEVAGALRGQVHLVVSGEGGGEWTVDCASSPGTVSAGLQGTAKLTVKCRAADLQALMKKERDAQLAILAGDLVLEPMDLDLARALAALF
ncbi:MAG: DUF697 domain-containing protein [Myxococcaceae bacterium]|nr:DUF697 domain-containing protein [Myxococcaceae bacterium]